MKATIKHQIALHVAPTGPQRAKTPPVQHVDDHANLDPAWDPNAPMGEEPRYNHGEQVNKKY